MTPTKRSDPDAHRPTFTTTHWSVVVAAAQGNAPGSREAWNQLATNYWPPLYSFIRRAGSTPHDAKDLTQGFFESVITRQALKEVSPGETRFRSFLLACLKNFLTDQHRRSQATIRRPAAGLLRLDGKVAEDHYQAELVDHATPASIYERQCAAIVLDKALARLEAYYSEQGRRDAFECLVAHLVRDSGAVPHLELAARLGTSETAVKSDMYRLRQRFRLFFRLEVAATVPPDEVEEEMRHVVRVLTR